MTKGIRTGTAASLLSAAAIAGLGTVTAVTVSGHDSASRLHALQGAVSHGEAFRVNGVTYTATPAGRPAASGATEPYSASPVRACAVTEDSYLTDCYGHRLAYSHGTWTAPALATVANYLR